MRTKKYEYMYVIITFGFKPDKTRSASVLNYFKNFTYTVS
jgi:hypothetical protein